MAISAIIGTLRDRYPVYGVRWNSATDVMTSGVVSDQTFVPYSYVNFPIQEKMKRCVCTHTSGVRSYYLDDANSLYKANGDLANLDGTDGQVMVELPKFHYMMITDGDNKYYFVSEAAFSFKKVDTSVVSSSWHPFFLEGGLSVPSDFKYISAFEGVLYRSSVYTNGTGIQTYLAGDLIRSIYGYIPLSYFNRTERRTASVDGNYHQWAYYPEEAMLLLYLTEKRIWNSQTAIPGYTEGGAWDFVKVCKTGVTVSLGNFSGSVLWENAVPALRCTTDQTGKYVANSFRGIENFYGHLWKWVDGININDDVPYICNIPANFADDTVTNYTSLGITMPNADNYQRNLFDGTFLPNSVTGGSSSTYITDYYWQSSGWRALLDGGSLNNGANVGTFARYASNVASNRTADVAGRLAL